MIGGIVLIVVLFALNSGVLSFFKGRIAKFDVQLMNSLYWYHALFALVYYIYVQSSPSDSVAYYTRAFSAYDNWGMIYGHGTPFIDFVAYPFVNYLHFTYEMMMVLFSYLGYLGFILFYITFQENIRFRHVVFGLNLMVIILFLPNMHYWTASLGKGSIIFFGLGLTVYGLSRLKTRAVALIAGLVLVYHVRPHVFFLLAVGILIGILTGKQKIPLYQKLLVIAVTAMTVSYLYDDIMKFANLDTENLLGSFEELSEHRAFELGKSGSGVDISGYPVVLKLFTFWFRPLFFDAPGPLGIIVSIENVFYVYLLMRVLNFEFFRFLVTSDALVKINAVILLSVSYALCGTLSNLGIIIRQKSMVMYFMVFIILAFLDYQKRKAVVYKPVQVKTKRRPFLPIKPA